MACPRAREVESTTRAMVPKYFVIRSSDKYRGTGPEDFSWILYYGLAGSHLSRATPSQTRAAAIQRRWSTAFFRKILAIIALTTKVMDAEAGATKLSSPQERAVSRLKKPTEKQQRASRKRFSVNTRTITASTLRLARSWSRSPIRFMALESKTSPPLEPSTIMKMAVQSSSDFIVLLARMQAGFPGRGVGEIRTARDPAHAAPNPQDPPPT